MDYIGRYELKGKLGKGGMAVVLEAHDPLFDRAVAIKILPPETTIGTDLKRRFLREARTLAALEHPAIVPVYDFGEFESRPYLVMRLMPGGSLHERIRFGVLALPVAAEILTRISDALDATHEQSIVHRDLKPANILFDRYDNAYLTDFGIVRLAEHSVRLTMNGVLGTPQYMAPEMVTLDGVSPLVDVYALTVTLYEMLTMKRPFDGITPIEIIRKHLNESVPDIRIIRPNVPSAVQQILERGMAKNPEERYQSASEMAADFVDAIYGFEEEDLPGTLDEIPLDTEPTTMPQLSIIQSTDYDVDVRPYITKNTFPALPRVTEEDISAYNTIPDPMPVASVTPKETEVIKPDSMEEHKKSTEPAQKAAEDPHQRATHERPSVRPDSPNKATRVHQAAPGDAKATMVHSVVEGNNTEPSQQQVSIPAAPAIEDESQRSNPGSRIWRGLIATIGFIAIASGVAWLGWTFFKPTINDMLGISDEASQTATAEASGVTSPSADTPTATFLPTITAQPGTAGSTVEVSVVATDLLDDNSNVIRRLGAGEVLTIEARSSEIRGDWLYVQTTTPDERGWVRRSDVNWQDAWNLEALEVREVLPDQ